MTIVVLLPGMDGSGSLFDDFIAALGTRTITIAYPPDRPLNYEQLECFVESSLPGEPYILLGESFSGPIAIRLASRCLPNLQAVVLVCTFATLPGRRAPVWFRKFAALIPFWRVPVRFGAPALLGDDHSPALRRKLLEAVERVVPSVWRARLGAILDVDVTAELATIRVPILYLRAERDRVVPQAAAAIISSQAVHARVVTISGPHALLQCRPSQCAAALKVFAGDSGITL
jgi:pimeloyl-[acyl-carrier protein] methyl ester esterase